MKDSKKKRSSKSGMPPGSLVFLGEQKSDKTTITVIEYSESSFSEKVAANLAECLPSPEKTTVKWIDVGSLHEVPLLEQLGASFKIHPLALEDILNTDQRPKIEDYGDYIYLVLKMLSQKKNSREIVVEQVSLILGSNYVISFQEIEGDVFDPIRERIRTGKGKIRKQGADYLAYCLIDAIVDNYFGILEVLGEWIQELEEAIVSAPTRDTLRQVYSLKREMIFLRRSIWPLREMVNGLERSESPLLQESTLIYLKDVYDHTIHTIDTIEAYRDMLAGMLDIYLSTNSNNLNQIMKVLTIISTIFIPLTFLAGVYGMNFDNMPELHWRAGYFILWGVMLVIGLVMLWMFRKKRWI